MNSYSNKKHIFCIYKELHRTNISTICRTSTKLMIHEKALFFPKDTVPEFIIHYNLSLISIDSKFFEKKILYRLP